MFEERLALYAKNSTSEKWHLIEFGSSLSKLQKEAIFLTIFAVRDSKTSSFQQHSPSCVRVVREKKDTRSNTWLTVEVLFYKDK